MRITQGIIPRAQRVVLYGGEGIGKTTLAAQFPDPLFIDTENGSTHLNVKRAAGIRTWAELLDAVDEVARTPGLCGTLVVDTLDRAERMATDQVLSDYNLKSIESAGYGRGYTYLAETFEQLLKACDRVIASGKHVVLVAHAKMRKFEQPDEMGAYDRWEMKLSRQVAPMVKEWCDMLLFLNYKTFVVTSENGTKKAQGGKRMIFTSHRPTFDAKNRHGLPDELELGFEGLAGVFGDTPEPMDSRKEAIDTLEGWMDEVGIAHEELEAFVQKMGWSPADGAKLADYPEKLVRDMMKSWKRIVDTILANRIG